MNAPTTQTKPSVSPSATPAVSTIAPPPFKLGTTTVTSPYLKMLVYGRPGVGKTELLASAADVPQMQDILYIDAESGDQTVHDNPRIKNWQTLIDNRIPVTSFKQVAAVHDWLVGHCQARDAFLKGNTSAKKALIDNEARLRGIDPSEIAEPKLFRSVILDSLSEIDAYSNYELLGVDEAKVLAGDADQVDVAGWDEFRKNNQRIQMLVRAFRNLPVHFLCVAAEQYKQDEMKKFHYEPKVTGQLARQVQGFFDIVGYMIMLRQGDKTERRLGVQPIDRFDAKNRRSVFSRDYFADTELNMTSIMKLTGLTR